jgi:hypothetical protein
MRYGEIRSTANIGQVVDFSGLRFGTILPTDVDAFIDFQNKLFIDIEAKYGDAEMPLGQRLALERRCDASRVPATVLVVRHNTPPGTPIDLANARAVAYYWRGQWVQITRRATCREFVEAMRRKFVG